MRFSKRASCSRIFASSISLVAVARSGPSYGYVATMVNSVPQETLRAYPLPVLSIYIYTLDSTIGIHVCRMKINVIEKVVVSMVLRAGCMLE